MVEVSENRFDYFFILQNIVKDNWSVLIGLIIIVIIMLLALINSSKVGG